MKKIITFLCFVTLLSCNNDDKLVISDDLIKRVILLESYDPYVSSYVSDSIIESYNNRVIVRKDHYLKLNKDASYVGFFQTYEYNAQNILIKTKSYNNFNLSEYYASSDYYYNEDDGIEKIEYNKFNSSNFSSTLANYTIHFDYQLDTVKSYQINHLNNDAKKDLKAYVVYGNLDSISLDNKWMHLFDSQNDLYAINCMGNDCDTYYNAKYEYGNNREPLINNIFGNDLNLFLLRSPIEHYNLERARKYTEKVLSVYPTSDRNGDTRRFNYTFDENNRLIEVNTSGTFAANDIIRYYYE